MNTKVTAKKQRTRRQHPDMQSGFNEIVEIHLKTNSYRMLYSDYEYEGKQEGNFYDVVQRMADHIVHPEERQDYIEFWKKDNIMRNLLMPHANNRVAGMFQTRIMDGQKKYLKLQVILFNNIGNNPILICMTGVQSEQEQIQQGDALASDDILLFYHETRFFHMIAQMVKEQQPRYVVTIACDINNFKLYNDIFGRDAGDEYLKKCYSSVKRFAQRYNGKTNYMGGDEFCVVLFLEEVQEEEICRAIEEEIYNAKYAEGFSPALGVHISETIQELESDRYDHALLALSDVRGKFMKHVQVYDALHYQKLRDTQILLMNVSQSLREKEIFFYVQPKVEMQTGKIIGTEALVRWKHNGRIVPPGDFIEPMEKNGYIVAVDRYIWEEVCIWLRKTADRGEEPLPVSVNVSRVDVHFMNVADYFEYLVQKYRLNPQWLEIEITESAFEENTEKLNKELSRLRKLGFHVLMDDFGSGFSSFNMLQTAEIDVIKIDQRFLMSNMNAKGIHIMESIYHMAKLLDMKVIVEGVETKEQRDLILQIGYEDCQGFYYFKPMSVDEFEHMICSGGGTRERKI